MIIFQGDAHLNNVRFGGPITVENSNSRVWATDCDFRALTLEAGSFQSLFLTNTIHADDLTLNGGGSFQAVVMAGVTLVSANLVIDGSFAYGLKVDANIRDGGFSLTDVNDATLNIQITNAVTNTMDTCHRNKCDLLINTVNQHGLHLTDSSSNRITGLITDAGRTTTNTYDGYILDGDSDRNHLALTVSYSGAGNQMRYGGNISAATCDDNVESSILTGSGATGNFNDAGTGTVLTDEHIV